MALREAVDTLLPSFEQAEAMVPARRRFVQALLGGGILTSLATFLYPIARYLVPPPATDMGGDSVLAAQINELKANSGKIFKFGSRPGMLIRNSDGEYKAL